MTAKRYRENEVANNNVMCIRYNTHTVLNVMFDVIV